MKTTDILILEGNKSDPREILRLIYEFVNSINDNQSMIRKEVWVLIQEDTLEQIMMSLEINLIRSKGLCIIRKIYAIPEQLTDQNYVKFLIRAIKQDRRTIMIGVPISRRIKILFRDFIQVHLTK
jgi:hypothetical protein